MFDRHALRHRYGSDRQTRPNPGLPQALAAGRSGHKNQNQVEAKYGSEDSDRPAIVHSVGRSLPPCGLTSGIQDRSKPNPPQGIWGNSKSKSGMTNNWL